MRSAVWQSIGRGRITLRRQVFGFRSQPLLRLLLGGMTYCFGRASHGTRRCMTSCKLLPYCMTVSEGQMAAVVQAQTAQRREVLAMH